MSDNAARRPLAHVIAVTGWDYLHTVVLDLLKQSFDGYKNRFQGSSSSDLSLAPERMYVSAAILLTAVAIEDFRNIAYLFDDSEIHPNQVPEDLCKLLSKKMDKSPPEYLKILLCELFEIRNTVAHSHLYHTKFGLNKESLMQIESWTLQPKHGSTRLREYKKKGEERTPELRLNLRPSELTFEDLFKSLVLTDTLLLLYDPVRIPILDSNLIPITVSHHQHSGTLCSVLNCYYNQLTNRSFVSEVEQVSIKLRRNLAQFVQPSNRFEWFITNQCPKCSNLGFQKNPKLQTCNRCGFSTSKERQN